MQNTNAVYTSMQCSTHIKQVPIQVIYKMIFHLVLSSFFDILKIRHCEEFCRKR